MTHRLTPQEYDRALDLEARDPVTEAARRQLIARVQQHRAEGKLPRADQSRAEQDSGGTTTATTVRAKRDWLTPFRRW